MTSDSPPGSAVEDSLGADPEQRLSEELRAVSSGLDAAFLDGRKLDDGYLIDRARAGSTEAFEVLVVRYRDRVFRVALRMVGDRASAEDVAQEALVAVWRGLPDFRGEAQFSTWLHQIVLNSARNHVTRRRLTDELTGAELSDPAGQPNHVVESQHRDDALRTAISELPFDQRAPLVMHQFEGFTYEQTAEVLQVSEATVRGRLFRARRSLAQSMREWR